MRSDSVKKGIHKAPHRSLLYATGVTKEGLKRPFIGIASSFSDLVPGHAGMRELERQIEKGIHSGGGQSFIFGVPAVCDGIAMGHSGMKYSLPSRDLIADCVESVAAAHQLDGLVLLTNCDKITPGMLMAALRLDIPCVVVHICHGSLHGAGQRISGMERDGGAVVCLGQLYLVLGEQGLLAGEEHGRVVCIGFVYVLHVAVRGCGMAQERSVGDDVQVFVQS